MSIHHISMSIEGLEGKLAGMRSDNMRAVYIRQSFGMEYEVFIETLEKMKEAGMKFIPGESCTNRKPDGSCGGHEDTVVPDDISQTETHDVFVFRKTGEDFWSKHHAERWLRETGYSYGSMEEGEEKIGIKKGDYIIEKWTDLDAEEKDFLEGYMIAESGSFQDGDIVVYIKKVSEVVDAAG